MDIAPLQNRLQYDLVRALLDNTRATPGARIVVGGGVPGRLGYFIEPTIVAGLSDDASLIRNEQFGPLVPALRYRDIDEAVKRANATRFGLGASVWSSDLSRAAAVDARLEAGTVWVNTHTVLDPDVPFGGLKESGIGRGNGEFGLQSCMEPTVIRLVKASGPGQENGEKCEDDRGSNRERGRHCNHWVVGGSAIESCRFKRAHVSRQACPIERDKTE